VQQQEHNRTGDAGFRVATRTHIGLRRKRNEDFLGVDHTPYGLLVVVCDGMGGHAGGDRASRLAVEHFTRTINEGAGEVRKLLLEGVERANGEIYGESVATGVREGMGTTLVAALVEGGRASVVNVGDSRCYLLHDGRLRRVSFDHSYVGELVASGQLTEEEAFVHPQRNIITRALGSPAPVQPDIFDISIVDGDALLLSSDGLHGLVPDRMIEGILNANTSPDRACDELVAAALAAGGSDNVTVALVRVGGGDDGGGPDTSPGTVPPTAILDGRDSSWITIWAVVILALLGLSWWGYHRFVADTAPVVPDSSAVAQPDSLSHADSLSSGTLIIGGDSLHPPANDSVVTSGRPDTVKDLSGTIGVAAPGDSGHPAPKRTGRRR
jgi:serine/threonine protein phosphatase PrpC